MIKLKDILRDLFEASTNIGGYSADEGEPDTGFIHGGKKRTLGKLQENQNRGMKLEVIHK